MIKKPCFFFFSVSSDVVNSIPKLCDIAISLVDILGYLKMHFSFIYLSIPIYLVLSSYEIGNKALFQIVCVAVNNALTY